MDLGTRFTQVKPSQTTRGSLALCDTQEISGWETGRYHNKTTDCQRTGDGNALDGRRKS